ncbi:hypothetical protein T02_14273 [Trichinella nativa]|uniref:Uncharacterized protein n=1 Tax=Trichinella nativa TaxID=6335 RepID=A0A0V1L2V6_9BILA|nr:hypothetical protein T02_14273 [Trichinella nativa]
MSKIKTEWRERIRFGENDEPYLSSSFPRGDFSNMYELTTVEQSCCSTVDINHTNMHNNQYCGALELGLGLADGVSAELERWSWGWGWPMALALELADGVGAELERWSWGWGWPMALALELADGVGAEHERWSWGWGWPMALSLGLGDGVGAGLSAGVSAEENVHQHDKSNDQYIENQPTVRM